MTDRRYRAPRKVLTAFLTHQRPMGAELSVGNPTFSSLGVASTIALLYIYLALLVIHLNYIRETVRVIIRPVSLSNFELHLFPSLLWSAAYPNVALDTRRIAFRAPGIVAAEIYDMVDRYPIGHPERERLFQQAAARQTRQDGAKATQLGGHYRISVNLPHLAIPGIPVRR